MLGVTAVTMPAPEESLRFPSNFRKTVGVCANPGRVREMRRAIADRKVLRGRYMNWNGGKRRSPSERNEADGGMGRTIRGKRARTNVC